MLLRPSVGGWPGRKHGEAGVRKDTTRYQSASLIRGCARDPETGRTSSETLAEELALGWNRDLKIFDEGGDIQIAKLRWFELMEASAVDPAFGEQRRAGSALTARRRSNAWPGGSA